LREQLYISRILPRRSNQLDVHTGKRRRLKQRRWEVINKTLLIESSFDRMDSVCRHTHTPSTRKLLHASFFIWNVILLLTFQHTDTYRYHLIEEVTSTSCSLIQSKCTFRLAIVGRNFESNTLLNNFRVKSVLRVLFFKVCSWEQIIITDIVFIKRQKNIENRHTTKSVWRSNLPVVNNYLLKKLCFCILDHFPALKDMSASFYWLTDT
jgi:hypothetical protein